MHHFSLRLRLAAFGGACLIAMNALAAEPAVDPSELPRVAPTEPAKAISTIQVRPGLRVELVAAEPLVVDPIAMCFDEDGRAFVVEMRDYSERRDERLGRIRMLEDTDGDGRFDRATIFAENLPWPTALIWFNGGLFVGSTPDILYFRDTDGDGRADQRKVVFTGFGSQVQRLNVQQLFNSFTWGLDNRIHGAAGGNGGVIRCVEHAERPPLDLRTSDFSFDPRTLEMRRENGGGQYGMSFDAAGRKFVCSNSAHIREVMYDYALVRPEMQYALPAPALDIPVDGPAAEVYRISPDEPWRVLRTKWRVAGLVPGPVEGGGRPSGYFTGASGIVIYRGTALGADFAGDAFVADIGSNLVHRKKLRPNGVPFKAERAADEQHSEFLASTDNWFRPVTFANAPDGALYILDMYREVVEHPWSLPPNLKKLLDLNSGNDRGRIYRVVANDFQQPPPMRKLSRASGAELVALLEHPNGWQRDTACRLIYERQDRTLVPQIRQLLRATSSPWGQIHAMSALSALTALSDDDLRTAANSPFSDVRENALRWMGGRTNLTAELRGVLIRAAGSKEPRERYQLAWTLAGLHFPERAGLLRKLAAAATDPWEKHAVYAAISTEPALSAEFPMAFYRNARAAVRSQPEAPVDNTTPRAEVLKQFSPALQLTGDSRRGKKVYEERCAACHRLFGQGTAVGPDLQSVRSAGRETTLQNILDPNREIAKGFSTYEILTVDGDEPLAGILASEAANGVTLRQANGVEMFIPRARLKNMRDTGKSLMPEGLEAGLKPQDLADLLDYITGQP